MVVRKKGGSLKVSPHQMKEVIYTQVRDHLKQLFKGSLNMLKKEMPAHNLNKLRVISNKLGDISKCNIRNLSLVGKKIRDQLKKIKGLS